MSTKVRTGEHVVKECIQSELCYRTGSLQYATQSLQCVTANKVGIGHEIEATNASDTSVSTVALFESSVPVIGFFDALAITSLSVLAARV
jgi:hypothetical protein